MQRPPLADIEHQPWKWSFIQISDAVIIVTDGRRLITVRTFRGRKQSADQMYHLAFPREGSGDYGHFHSFFPTLEPPSSSSPEPLHGGKSISRGDRLIVRRCLSRMMIGRKSHDAIKVIHRDTCLFNLHIGAFSGVEPHTSGLAVQILMSIIIYVRS